MGCDGLHRNPATMGKYVARLPHVKNVEMKSTFYYINAVVAVFKWKDNNPTTANSFKSQTYDNVK